MKNLYLIDKLSNVQNIYINNQKFEIGKPRMDVTRHDFKNLKEQLNFLLDNKFMLSSVKIEFYDGLNSIYIDKRLNWLDSKEENSYLFIKYLDDNYSNRREDNLRNIVYYEIENYKLYDLLLLSYIKLFSCNDNVKCLNYLIKNYHFLKNDISIYYMNEKCDLNEIIQYFNSSNDLDYHKLFKDKRNNQFIFKCLLFYGSVYFHNYILLGKEFNNYFNSIINFITIYDSLLEIHEEQRDKICSLTKLIFKKLINCLSDILNMSNDDKYFADFIFQEIFFRLRIVRLTDLVDKFVKDYGKDFEDYFVSYKRYKQLLLILSV